MERVKSEALDAILGQEFKVLDKGFIRVVDYMGNDEAIVQAARTSYGKGLETPTKDRGLVRYLMRHRHESPFEQCMIKLHVKLPITVARQWIRHRTAKVNEESARYTIVQNEFYIPSPERLRLQSVNNKQGSSDEVVSDAEVWHEMFQDTPDICHVNYNSAIKAGIAKEISRVLLPESRYTQWYWTIDLRNLFNFLLLRKDVHAQEEIRLYADVIGDIVEQWVPWAWEAFVDYRLEAVTLSRMEFKLVSSLLHVDWDRENLLALFDGEGYESVSQKEMTKEGMSKREINEFLEKFQ